MAITATMVRELRDMTGAAMMECKKALEAAGGDIQQAIDHLRKQGLKSAAKKASRETGEGRVIAVLGDDGRRGHMVAMACETDFLAGSDQFKAFMAELQQHVAACDPTGVDGGARALLDQPWMGKGKQASERISEAVGAFGENLRVHQLVRLENSEGLVGHYIHHDNKRGAIVSVTTAAERAKAEACCAACASTSSSSSPPTAPARRCRRRTWSASGRCSARATR